LELNRSVLIAAYYWPPSGGAGVQRWLKLAKELDRLGWRVHVLTVDPEDATFPHVDTTLLNEIPASIAVHRSRAFNPIALGKRVLGRHANTKASSDLKGSASALGKLAMRIRTHLFVPDPRKGWNRHAIALGKRIIDAEKIDLVITTSPPHSTQLIGLELKRRTGVKWLADFRDPWTDVFYYDLLMHSKWSARRDLAYEAEVLRHADAVLVVHDKYREKLEAKYPESVPGKVFYLPNGFDESDFKEPSPEAPSDWFELVYTGIMAAGYEPEVVMRAIEQWKPDRRVRLTVVGQAPEALLDGFRAAGAEVQCLGMQPHHVANAWQLRAHALLCLIPAIPGADLAHVPGKVFEYLACGKPIVNIGPKAGETAGIIRDCQAGKTFERNEYLVLADFLEQVRRGEWRVGHENRERVRAYSRREQAQVLERIMRGL